jgi:flagellar FliL protein
MATSAPKAVPKVAPKPGAKPTAPEPLADAPAPKKSKKKMILLIVAALVLLGGAGGGAAWYFMGGNAPATATAAAKIEPPKLPVFVVLEPFTVNLQSETGDQFLQITLTLQVPDQAQDELFKTFMPQVRSRLLFLLSSKKAAEISTIEGKKKLTDDIIATVNESFSPPKGPPQRVSNVFFTSFVIQ